MDDLYCYYCNGPAKVYERMGPPCAWFVACLNDETCGASGPDRPSRSEAIRLHQKVYRLVRQPEGK